MEIFKNIGGFEGLYKITSSGKVLSLGNGGSTDPRTKIPRMLKTQIKANGYEQVKLCKEGSAKYFTVHRLVATHFLMPIEGKNEVNHKDGDKLNNDVSNLEWCFASDNQKHAFKLGLQKAVRGKDHKQSIPVNQFDLEGNLIKTWDSIKQIKREIGFNTFGIIKCCKKEKKYKTAYGFKWEYAKS